jgi:hypothetical protein
VGRGRRGHVGLWEGSCFLTIAKKFGEWAVKREPYYTHETGTFQPFAVVDEGVVVDAVGTLTMWDKHYARRIEFGAKADQASSFSDKTESAPEQMTYESIPVFSRVDVEGALLRDKPDELLYAVLSAALYGKDFAWAQDVCLRLAKHPDRRVRGNAMLGFGHLARLHRRL